MGGDGRCVSAPRLSLSGAGARQRIAARGVPAAQGDTQGRPARGACCVWTACICYAPTMACGSGE